MVKTGYDAKLIIKKPIPPHPGEILLHDFLKPMKLSQSRFSKETGVSLIIVKEIIRGKYSVNAEIAKAFAQYLGTTAEWWTNMQRYYDVETRKLHSVI